jgi:hypothetical protein
VVCQALTGDIAALRYWDTLDDSGAGLALWRSGKRYPLSSERLYPSFSVWVFAAAVQVRHQAAFPLPLGACCDYEHARQSSPMDVNFSVD